MKANYFISLLLVLLLSACGFHLRGVIDIPEWLNNVSIISRDGDKDLISKMKTQLEGYKIDVNPDPANAKYWLIINKSNVHQQIISIGASTNPRQYQLIMTTLFSLQTPKGQIIKAPKQVMVTRQLTVNNNRILGSNEEETILLNEMHQDTVIQILNRISRK
ncbi:LPS assembly lipoprotein LptE [Legionella quateirensis]|uniref:LPS-assembly lipoprotein LptE n=1 Tax=Legionella quateirensis TaxID=45072 RepID=A0A378KXJ4_9GAMM|nr:LPS assembly lipoprotein LptE [Legionella quateirensis]KTD43209.1 rare lipoprotein B [Legionella quateirensis]STY18088.1 Rare lipoprotein B [Legionella quateirensis]